MDRPIASMLLKLAVDVLTAASILCLAAAPYAVFSLIERLRRHIEGTVSC